MFLIKKDLRKQQPRQLIQVNKFLHGTMTRLEKELNFKN